jgi:hypothetical protein
MNNLFHWSFHNLLNENPGSFPLPQCEQRTTNSNDEGVSKGSTLRDRDFFSRRKTEIEKPAAIFRWTLKPLNAAPLVERNVGQASYRRMKTIIIFNFHTANMPERQDPRQGRIWEKWGQ